MTHPNRAAENRPPTSSPLRSCRTHLVLAFALSGLIAFLYFAPAIYMLQVYDRVVQSGSVMTLVFLSVALVIALYTLSSLEAVRARTLARAGDRIEKRLAPILLSAGFANSLAAHGQQLPVSPLRRMDEIKRSLSGTVISSLFDLCFTPLFIIACFLLHFWIGVFVTGACLVMVLLGVLNRFALRRVAKRHQDSLPQLHALHEADQQSGNVARSMGMLEALVARHVSARKSVSIAQVRTQLLSGELSSVSRFFRLVFQSGALGVGAYLAINREISLGAMIAGSILAGRALAPTDGLIRNWEALQSFQRAVRELREFLGLYANQPAPLPLPPPSGEVALEGISARSRDGKTIALFDISFRVRAGTVVGIIGDSGAGKSTLARILACAERPANGDLRFDNSNVREWDSERLGKYIGFLPQDIGLLGGTVWENISRFANHGAETVDREAIGEAVIRAAKAAGAHEMIQRFPDGYETVLSMRGGGLSAGQSQRIALARAIYGEPPILVMDEPNAHLDQNGRMALRASIMAAKERGATTFIVTHQAGLMDITDRLLLLNKGRLDLFGPTQKVLEEVQKRARRVQQYEGSATEAPAGEARRTAIRVVEP